MKTNILKNGCELSLLSLLVVVVFIYMAVASNAGDFMINQSYDPKTKIYHVQKKFGEDKTANWYGKKVDGEWHGDVKIEYYEQGSANIAGKEEAFYIFGERHGPSKYTYPDGAHVIKYYKHGKLVTKSEYFKLLSMSSGESSAYEIFHNTVFHQEFKLHAFGYDSMYLKSFMDTLEHELYSENFDKEEFEDRYESTVDSLSKTPYDSLIQFNSIESLYNGISLVSGNEFRLANKYSYSEGDSNTYQVVKTMHPNYVQDLYFDDVTDEEFKEFCHVYDSIMKTYVYVPSYDPFFVDSLDARMYRTLDHINADEDEESVFRSTLKSMTLKEKEKRLSVFCREFRDQIEVQEPSGSTPADIAAMVLYTVFEKIAEGDDIKNSVQKSFLIRKEIVQNSVLITEFSDQTSSTSAVVSGNVLDDGGGDIIECGIAYDIFYNPVIENNFVASHEIKTEFEITLDGLTAGKTYYARSFATNSAGTSYGNCISFVAGATGIKTENFHDGLIKFYPNPASDELNVSMNVKYTDKQSLCIYDINGRTVFQQDLSVINQGENIYKLKLNQLPDGIYNCAIRIDGEVYQTQKFVIKH